MSTFNEFHLSDDILQAVEDLGFVNPTPIQEQTIPFLLEENTDLVALAQTGTGKTAAFGLPIIEKTDLGKKYPQTLILAPTRELAVQISKDIKSFALHIKGFRVSAVYGGTNIETQIKELKAGAHIVVGTPGRVLDLSKRKKLDLSKIRFLILDEADEMLNMGFKDELDSILAHTPEDKQVLLFSATMPKEVVRIANKYMRDAATIEVGKRNQGAENVDHTFYSVQAKDKYKALKRIADMAPDIYGIVFCRTRRETREVAEKLIADNYNADALHGDLSQNQRDLVMHRFRVKNIQLLVATDVAARGLDVDSLTHVINYSLPDEEEAYIHRTGRTGRAGKMGKAVSIVHQREIGKLRRIEQKLGKSIKKELVPGGKEICEKRLFNLVDTMEKVEVNEEQVNEFLPTIYKKLEWLSKEELIKRFVSVEFNRFLEYYKHAEDLNVVGRSSREDGRARSGNFTRFFINIGKKNNLRAAALISFINRKLSEKNFAIGKIDILRNFSFFEVDSSVEKDVLRNMNGAKFDNIKLLVEIASEKKGRGEYRDRNERKDRRDRSEKGAVRSVRKRGRGDKNEEDFPDRTDFRKKKLKKKAKKETSKERKRKKKDRNKF
jgi:ATP-dependent RNA helicase DeaD